MAVHSKQLNTLYLKLSFTDEKGHQFPPDEEPDYHSNSPLLES